MKTKLGSKFWVALVIFSLCGQVAWVVENMYFNVFIYKMFNASAADISLMVGASSVAATVTTLIIGALSDKVGKRKIFICGGYITWGISILCFALIRVDVISAIIPSTLSAAAVGVTLTIILDCVMTFFGSAANDACFNAWLTDSTDSTNRGAAEGINAMMPLVAILVVFGGFMGFDQSLASSWTLIFIIIGSVVVLIGIAGIFLIKDPAVKATENNKYFANIIYGFRPSVIKQNYLLYLCLGAFAIFNISIQTYMPYLILYYEVSLNMSNYVFIMAPAIILASVFTFFYGKTYDKWRFKRSVIPTIIALVAGYVLLFLFKGTVLVFIGSLFMMCGYLSGMAIFGAVVRDLTPPKKTGMFQGLRIFAQVLIPGIIGPAIGAWVLADAKKIVGGDGTEQFIPNENIFLAALIVAAVLAIVLALVFIVIHKNKNNEFVNKIFYTLPEKVANDDITEVE
ncbi:MAG: MFS transporter [Clostridiales bacterium]|nr:MFS transporter [Clostridiales bacterium]